MTDVDAEYMSRFGLTEAEVWALFDAKEDNDIPLCSLCGRKFAEHFDYRCPGGTQ